MQKSDAESGTKRVLTFEHGKVQNYRKENNIINNIMCTVVNMVMGLSLLSRITQKDMPENSENPPKKPRHEDEAVL